MTDGSDQSHVELLPFGVDGILVRFALTLSPEATAQVQGLQASLRTAPLPGQIETAPALGSVLVRFDPAITTRRAVSDALMSRLVTRVSARTPTLRHWHIPAAFDGDCAPQLAEAAARAGVTEAQAIKTITQTPLQVLAIGFAPGQPYLGQLPKEWDLPRQTALTPNVPAGALVVAIRQIVLFANPSPTGWRQIGLTAFRCFQPEKTEAFPLQPGDTVSFERVDAATLGAVRRNADGMGGARLVVTS